MKAAEENKIVINTDCRKVWELSTSKTLKASQLAGDVGTVISKIAHIESKSKIQFE